MSPQDRIQELEAQLADAKEKLSLARLLLWRDGDEGPIEALKLSALTFDERTTHSNPEPAAIQTKKESS